MIKRVLSILILFPSIGWAEDCFDEITPCAHAAAAEYGVFFTGEMLYWKSEEDQLHYTKVVTPVSPPNLSTSLFDTQLIPMEFNWQPAFRLGMGYRFCSDCWDLYADWTFYHTHSKASMEKKTPCLSLLLTQDQGRDTNKKGVELASTACASWEMTFHTIDLELGRHYWISCALSLRPFFGIKGTWIAQTFDVKYKDTFFVDQGEVAEFLGSTKLYGKGDFWGVGPRLGVQTKWHLSYGFSILANGSVAILSGWFDPFARIVYNDATLDPSRVVQHINKDSVLHLRPVAELYLGLEWGRCFSGCTYLYLSFGYELNYYFEQMHFPFPGNVTPNGDLSLHGLTLSLRFDF